MKQTTRIPKGHFLFTSESVSRGHPDKICDYISDSVLDAHLQQDPFARVACESSCKNDLMMVFGEVTSRADVNYEKIVRQALKEIGYDHFGKGCDYKDCTVLISIKGQSEEIAHGIHVDDVDIIKQKEEAALNIGAGDQGLMIGYASDETPELMPLSSILSHRILQRLTELREQNIITWLRPDAKSQVTVEYKKWDDVNIQPFRVHTVLVSQQHDEHITQEEIEQTLIDVVKQVIPQKYIDENTKYFMNPSKSFTIGGPYGDAGLTGRKIIVDTYGGWAGHGGGAFSGKDPTKVDRSGAYAARWVAKSLVQAKLCKRCTIQISYGIGIAEPLSINVNTHNTVKKGFTDEDLVEIIYENFDLRPGALIRDLNLRRPIYKNLSAFGHFGRTEAEYLWEQPKKIHISEQFLNSLNQQDSKQKVNNKPTAQIKEKKAVTEEVKKPTKKKEEEEIDVEYIEKVQNLKIVRSNKGIKRVPIQGQKNILITSALPYVNNVPHLGNLIGCVLSADVFSRYCRLRNYNAIYICGTDEYGTTTEMKAKQEKLTPQELCDKYHKIHKEVYDWFDIDFDEFGRTSTPQQTTICQDIFLQLRNNNYTTEKVIQQQFCTVCDTFLADRMVEGICPKCGANGARGDQCDTCQQIYDVCDLIEPKCVHCLNTPVIRDSKHIFINLPQITDQLIEWIHKSSENGNWSSNSKSVTLAWVNQGLKERCITRDLKWGIQVPLEEFKDKVFYVWFDAPIGYLSITASYTEQWEKWWKNPEQVKLYQFMGKDNVPFHTVIFPSTLIGATDKFTLLHHISTTEYLNYEDGKFSKSKCIGVFGDNAQISGIPVEVWRYYLLINRPEQSDTLFLWSDFASKNNNELLANIGNLCQRALKFAYANYNQQVPNVDVSKLIDVDHEFLNNIYSLFLKYTNQLDNVEIKQGLKTGMEIGQVCNKYMQDNAPWEAQNKQAGRSEVVIGVILNILRLISAVFEPYIPSFSAKLNFLLGNEVRTDRDEIIFDYILDNGSPTRLLTLTPSGQKLNKPIPLFKLIKEDEVQTFRDKYGGKQIKEQNS